mmetsp:Transcript_39309/g.95114  ORF Transcript_39309/g.95114 Transcript_39309/m.95114 type:complete len:307 (+) Transcript_39309:3810-4730(+)
MVLWSDVATSSSEINTRLVHTTVTVLQLVGLGTSGQSKQLVSKTDTKDWLGLLQVQGVLDRLDGSCAHLWVTRTVGQEETLPINVGWVGLQVVVEWNDGQFNLVGVDQVSDNVVFDTAVVGNDPWGLSLSVGDNLLGGDFSDQVSIIGVLEHIFTDGTSKLLWLDGRFDLKSSKDGTVFSQGLCQLSGINTKDSWDTRFLEPVAKRLFCIPVRMLPRVAGNNQSRDVDLLAFKVLGKTVGVHCGFVGDTIVSNQWVCEHKDLATVTRIGQCFRVSNHSSVEDDLSCSDDRSTESCAFDCVAISHVK